MHSCRLKRHSGFTLVELIIVLVVLGILSVYAVMNNSSPSAYTLRSQAEMMANDLRHVQTLATTWGKRLRVDTVAGVNGTYSVTCDNASVIAPCNGANPVTNPATGSSYTVSLQQGASLSGPATLVVDSLGKPNTSATYVLTAGSASKSVNVLAITGFVSVP